MHRQERVCRTTSPYRNSVWLWICLCFCLSVCLPVCLTLCLSVCLSVCLSICLSVRLFMSVYLSVCVSVCLSLCLSLSLSLCLSLYLCLWSLWSLSDLSLISTQVSHLLRELHYSTIYWSWCPMLSNHQRSVQSDYYLHGRVVWSSQFAQPKPSSAVPCPA